MADLVQIRDMQQKKQSEKRKNKKVLGIAAGIIVLGMAVLFIVSYYLNVRRFDSFEVLGQVERSDSGNIGYIYLNHNILKYSRSGISAVNNEGKVLWNGGFEMKQPKVDICGDYVIAADVTGKQFFVYSGEDEGTGIETTLPIARAKVAANGMAAVLLQDTDSNVLNIYNPYNTTTQLLVEIPTNVAEEGYPLDFDISPDGASVVTSYLTVSGNKVESRVSFYNFTEVGQDKNTLVGGKTFGESMISCVEFVGDDKVAVFHENGVTLFTKMKQPEVLAELKFEEELASVAFSEDYIAIVTQENEEKKTLHLYNHRGKEKLKKEISYEYSDMKIYGEEILFLSNHSCSILRVNGHEKLVCEFDNGIDAVFPTQNGNIYTLIEPEYIKRIKLARQ